MGTYWEMLWDFLVKHRKQIRYSSKTLKQTADVGLKTLEETEKVGVSRPSADAFPTSIAN
jgi:hypothetical protein